MEVGLYSVVASSIDGYHITFFEVGHAGWQLARHRGHWYGASHWWQCVTDLGALQRGDGYAFRYGLGTGDNRITTVEIGKAVR